MVRGHHAEHHHCETFSQLQKIILLPYSLVLNILGSYVPQCFEQCSTDWFAGKKNSECYDLSFISVVFFQISNQNIFLNLTKHILNKGASKEGGGKEGQCSWSVSCLKLWEGSGFHRVPLIGRKANISLKSHSGKLYIWQFFSGLGVKNDRAYKYCSQKQAISFL